MKRAFLMLTLRSIYDAVCKFTPFLKLAQPRIAIYYDSINFAVNDLESGRVRGALVKCLTGTARYERPCCRFAPARCQVAPNVAGRSAVTRSTRHSSTTASHEL